MWVPRERERERERGGMERPLRFYHKVSQSFTMDIPTTFSPERGRSTIMQQQSLAGVKALLLLLFSLSFQCFGEVPLADPSFRSSLFVFLIFFFAGRGARDLVLLVPKTRGTARLSRRCSLGRDREQSRSLRVARQDPHVVGPAWGEPHQSQRQIRRGHLAAIQTAKVGQLVVGHEVL